MEARSTGDGASFPESIFGKPRAEPAFPLNASIQFPAHSGGTEPENVSLVIDQKGRRLTDLCRLLGKPKKRTGIEEKTHRPHFFNSWRFMGASAASGKSNGLPLISPTLGRRRFLSCSTGTSLATGFLPLEIMNCFPSSTSDKYLDKCVFASWVVMSHHDDSGFRCNST